MLFAEKDLAMNETKKQRDLDRRVDTEIVDNFDEELEMEIEDERWPRAATALSEHPGRNGRTARSTSRNCFDSSPSW